MHWRIELLRTRRQPVSANKPATRIPSNRAKAVALVVVLVLSAAPRIAWYRTHQPDLPPDAFGYLNVAREWRGEHAPGEWDDRAALPWDNQATRTPGYPLFLDLVFAAVGHTKTPTDALANAQPLLASGVGTGARAFHLRHFETDENVRAVQAAQHLLAVLGTGAAFLALVAWTESVVVAAIGALIAIGWNPVWIITLEPALLAEVLSGVLLIHALTFVSYRRAWTDHVSLSFAALAVAVRPPMLVPALCLAAHVVWRRRAERRPSTRPLVVLLVVLSLLIANNVWRYGYWGLASNGGTTLASHAAEHPEDLREPIRAHILRHHPYLRGGLLQYSYAVATHRRFLDVEREVTAAAQGFIVDHPLWYSESVIAALVDFFSPPFRYVGGDRNLFRQRWPSVWTVISVAGSAVALAGVAALFLPVSPVAKTASTIVLLSGISTSLLAHTENRRFAAPLMPLLLMSGTTACYESARRWTKCSVYQPRGGQGDATQGWQQRRDRPQKKCGLMKAQTGPPGGPRAAQG